MYGNGSTSLSAVLNGLGAHSDYERQQWLEIIGRLSGSDHLISSLFKWVDTDLKNTTSSVLRLKQQVMRTQLRLADTWYRHEQSITDEQRQSLDDYGYTFMDRQQHMVLYEDPNSSETWCASSIIAILKTN